MIPALVIFLLALALGPVAPWWGFGLAAFLVPWWRPLSAGRAFGSGASAIAALWLVQCLLKTLPNDNLLAGRVATLFMLPHWTGVLLAAVLAGGLLGGLAAWSGQLAAACFRPAVSRHFKVKA